MLATIPTCPRIGNWEGLMACGLWLHTPKTNDWNPLGSYLGFDPPDPRWMDFMENP